MSYPVFELSQSNLPRDLVFVREFRPGFHNRSYLFESETGEKFVFRQQVYFGGVGRLDAEARALKFLDHVGIDFAPKSLFSDSKQNLHVMSYIEGDDLELNQLTDDHAKIFASHVAQLHSISPDAYRKWCEKEGLTITEINAGGFVLSSLDIIAETCPDRFLAKWISDKAEVYKELLAGKDKNLECFVHGDLGGNIKYDGQNLSFIDWENSGIWSSSDFGYMFIHGKVSDSMQKVILDEYVRIRNFSSEQIADLKGCIADQKILMRIDKVVYRTRRYSELLASDPEAAENFRAQAYQVLEEEFGLKPNRSQQVYTGPKAEPH